MSSKPILPARCAAFAAARSYSALPCPTVARHGRGVNGSRGSRFLAPTLARQPDRLPPGQADAVAAQALAGDRHARRARRFSCRWQASRWTWRGSRRRAIACWAWNCRRLAIEQFIAEHGWCRRCGNRATARTTSPAPSNSICGDVFALDADALADCSAVFDRAALIALPPELRQRYVQRVVCPAAAGCRGLLITLEYPPHEKQGPPFTVTRSRSPRRCTAATGKSKCWSAATSWRSSRPSSRKA